VPYKRKSPIRHRVSGHIREGHHIATYLRGHGGKAANPFLHRRVITSPSSFKEGIWCEHEGRIKPDHCGECDGKESFSKSHEPRQYTVTLKYADGGKETVKTVAHSPEESLHFAMMKSSRRGERPVEVTSKNLLGDIVGRLAGWAVGGVKKAAATYRATREKAKVGEEARKEELEEQKELTQLAQEKRLENMRARARRGDMVAQRYLEKRGISPY
jgi:hypothetical protein